MNNLCEVSGGPVDDAAFRRGGAVEACRRYLAQHAISEQKVPIIYCRFGEALLHRGRPEEAVACARVAFDLAADNEEVATICGWVFSNCGRHSEAAAAYEQLLESRPDWAEGHRHASGSFAAAGQMDHAMFHAEAACDLKPDSFEFHLHAAHLFRSVGRYQEAVTYLTRAAAIVPGDGDVLRQLSSAKFVLGQYYEAVALALRALALTPEDRLSALHATELLLRTGRLDEAAAIILEAVEQQPRDTVALRLLSETEMQRGRTEGALSAIHRALAIEPAVAEYHCHRANLLYRLGRLDEAAEAFGCAAALDPGNTNAKRSQLTAYYDNGRFAEALAVGAELIRLAPENEEYAQAVLEVLNRRLATLEGDWVVLCERAAQPRRDLRPPPGICAALQSQMRVIGALIIRETRTRFGDSKLGYGWALLEPILHILMLSLVFAVMMHGRPPIGEKFFIFYYTGIIRHSGANGTKVVDNQKPTCTTPRARNRDLLRRKIAVGHDRTFGRRRFAA